MGLGVVDYSGRTNPVTVTIGGSANDGEPGERDNITRTLSVVGGQGNDLLVAGNRGSSLVGGGGTMLAGGGGSDVVRGGSRTDILSATTLPTWFLDGTVRLVDGPRESSADRLSGGGGDDILFGSDGANTLAGGTGLDTLFGLDGPDLLDTVDRDADVLRCGAGVDRARMDVHDFSRSRGQQRCERTRRSTPAVATEVGGFDGPSSRGVGDRRSAAVLVGCPGDAPRVCRGTVRLVFRGRTLGTARFRLARNRTRKIDVRMSRRGRRLITRRGELVAVAVVRTRDRRGRVRETRVGGNAIWAYGPDNSEGDEDG